MCNPQKVWLCCQRRYPGGHNHGHEGCFDSGNATPLNVVSDSRRTSPYILALNYRPPLSSGYRTTIQGSDDDDEDGDADKVSTPGGQDWADMKLGVKRSPCPPVDAVSKKSAEIGSALLVRPRSDKRKHKSVVSVSPTICQVRKRRFSQVQSKEQLFHHL